MILFLFLLLLFFWGGGMYFLSSQACYWFTLNEQGQSSVCVCQFSREGLSSGRCYELTEAIQAEVGIKT